MLSVKLAFRIDFRVRSAVEFRTGMVDADGGLTIDDVGPHVVGGRRSPPQHFYKLYFAAKLAELGAINELSTGVLERLDARFTLEELVHVVARGEVARCRGGDSGHGERADQPHQQSATNRGHGFSPIM